MPCRSKTRCYGAWRRFVSCVRSAILSPHRASVALPPISAPAHPQNKHRRAPVRCGRARQNMRDRSSTDQGDGKRRAGVVTLCSDAEANPVMPVPDPSPDVGRRLRCLFSVTIGGTISVLVPAATAILRTAIIGRGVIAPLFESVIAIIPVALR
jgi:hypothetical protein